MEKYLKYSIISSVAALVLTGCGGGGSSTSSNLSAVFKDAGVDGLTYTCGTTTNTTTDGGKFTIDSTQCNEVEFSIGNVKLGSIAVIDITDGVVYPTDLTPIERTDTTQTDQTKTENENLINMLRFLQSFDDNPNDGIQINLTEDQKNSLPTLDFSKTIGESDLKTALNTVGKTLKKTNHAIAHYEETLREDLAIDIDTVPPAPPVIEKEISATSSDTVTLEIVGEKGTSVFLNGNDTGVVINDEGKATINIENLVDGNNNFDIKLKDQKHSLDITDSTSTTITKDTTAPDTPTSNAPSVTNLDSITTTISGEDGTEVFLDGTTVGTISNGTLDITLDLSGEDGDKTFAVTLKDTAGNESSALNLSIQKNSSAPNKPTATIGENTYLNTSSSNLDSVSTTISGEEGAEVFVNGTSVGTISSGTLDINLDTTGADGTKTFNITLKDNAGNISSALVLNVIKDTSAPSLPTHLGTVSAINSDSTMTTISGEDGTEVYVNGTKFGTISGGSLEITLDTSGSDGTKTFAIVLKDAAGNESSVLNISIIKDTAAPAVATNSSIPTYINSATSNPDLLSTTISGEDGTDVYVDGLKVGTISGGALNIDLNTSGEDGTKSFAVTLKDAAGNESSVLNISIIKDTTAPAVAKDSGTPSAVNSDTTTTTISGEDGTEVFVNGNKIGTISNGTLDVKLNMSGDDGAKTFAIVLKDAAGNESSALNISIIKDTTAPAVAKDSGTASAVNSDTTTTISGEDGTEVFVNGVSVGIISGGTLDITLDMPGEDGTKTFTIILKDAAGNESGALNISVIKDTVAPSAPNVLSQTALVDNKLSATISGEVGSKVIVNNVEYGEIGTLGTLNILIDNPGNSYYETLEVKLQDIAGNVSSITNYVTTFSRINLNTDTTYFIPENISVLRNSATNEEAIIMAYETNQAVSGAVAKILIDVNTSVSDKLAEIISAIASASNLSTPVKLIEQLSSTTDIEKVLAEYTLTSYSSIGTIDLISQIVNGIMGGNLTNLPTTTSGSLLETYFNIKFNLEKDVNTGESYLTMTLVPNNVALNYQTIIGSILNTGNISNNTETLVNNIDTFTASASTTKTADFVFVVDDSGSMSSYQTAVSQAANDFANAITNAGLNFRAGIITTSCGTPSDTCYYSSDDYDRVLNNIGIIENDVEAFKTNVKVGTYGDGTETGIYNAEYALQSIALGDTIDGPLTSLNIPQGNELSVIILSDEPSQYPRRSGGTNFDINNNLFIDRGYNVYSIVKPDSSLYCYSSNGCTDGNPSKYDDLAIATGGMVADISNTTNYSTIMNTIAQNASGNLGYKLNNEGVVESTIFVTVNGVEVAHDNTNGWRYIQNSNSVLFYGTAIPQDGDEIKIQYSYKH
ncbi:hypothetical protein GCM10012288_19250 [Malaciobacter pacificus]|uniref:Uncharacterized protein n=1 Tax=Malaciobacter pacificus TaxID=1080223 RepID=A0A5C2HGX6_9BACT|nr:hypothetical protein [Malaciobacter pacificus]QEP35642.1 hypothetical protein APAC_2601 [Malaciobacter pacificus]GGD45054.1 hypothetical protein GCM10012288_19250 [Malaciobacter pacificus]